WDLQPGSTMTNATVDSSVAGVDGQVITVKYKDGEKKVIVTPQTIIVRYVDGTKDELKPGVRLFLNNAIKKPDGTIEVPTVTEGRAVAPPMGCGLRRRIRRTATSKSREDDMTRTLRALAVTAIVAVFAAVNAWAQAPTRVRGTIEKVDGDLLMVKSREGTDLKLKLKPDASV